MVSKPLDALIRSLPAPPTIRSLPSSPVMLSSPCPPMMVSSPVPAIIRVPVPDAEASTRSLPDPSTNASSWLKVVVDVPVTAVPDSLPVRTKVMGVVTLVMFNWSKSLPVSPPTIVSLPAASLTRKTSASAPPVRLSLPAPPLNQSSPSPPKTVSSPAPPSRTSLPAPPEMLSAPLPPTTVSLPSLALIVRPEASVEASTTSSCIVRTRASISAKFVLPEVAPVMLPASSPVKTTVTPSPAWFSRSIVSLSLPASPP